MLPPYGAYTGKHWDPSRQPRILWQVQLLSNYHWAVSRVRAPYRQGEYVADLVALVDFLTELAQSFFAAEVNLLADLAQDFLAAEVDFLTELAQALLAADLVVP